MTTTHNITDNKIVYLISVLSDEFRTIQTIISYPNPSPALISYTSTRNQALLRFSGDCFYS